MKRILYLIKGLGRGGAEQLLASAATYRDTSRFEYEVAYLLPWKNALVSSMEAAGIPAYCLEAGHGVGWTRRLNSLVRRNGIDLVHVHSPYAAVGARLAIGPHTARLVYTEHNVWSRYHRATYWGNAVTYPRNDHVFAVSDSVRESVRYPRPLRPLRMPAVETLYQGLDPAVTSTWGVADGVREELGIPEGVPIVGSIANFKPYKGHHELVRAAVEVRRAIPEVRFVLVGVGPLEAEVRAEADQLGVADALIFAGFRDDVPRILGAFDVFTLGSMYEGLSIALIEAMAVGKAVVVTRAGGLPEVVTDGINGLLVPTGDVRALADGLITLLSDEGLRERFGCAARRRAGDFDIRRTVRRTEEVYEELLT
jgi:glycosyltransferase involved in cell wall biosynthesis